MVTSHHLRHSTGPCKEMLYSFLTWQIRWYACHWCQHACATTGYPSKWSLTEQTESNPTSQHHQIHSIATLVDAPASYEVQLTNDLFGAFCFRSRYMHGRQRNNFICDLVLWPFNVNEPLCDVGRDCCIRLQSLKFFYNPSCEIWHIFSS